MEHGKSIIMRWCSNTEVLWTWVPLGCNNTGPERFVSQKQRGGQSRHCAELCYTWRSRVRCRGQKDHHRVVCETSPQVPSQSVIWGAVRSYACHISWKMIFYFFIRLFKKLYSNPPHHNGSLFILFFLLKLSPAICWSTHLFAFYVLFM